MPTLNNPGIVLFKQCVPHPKSGCDFAGFIDTPELYFECYSKSFTLHLASQAHKLALAADSQKQYWEIKQKYRDVILFFKVGTFYELYEDDAQVGHDVLGWKMTITGVGHCRQVPSSRLLQSTPANWSTLFCLRSAFELNLAIWPRATRAMTLALHLGATSLQPCVSECAPVLRRGRPQRCPDVVRLVGTCQIPCS